MREWVSVNGQLLPADEARVSVFDSGFMQGIGLFETMRTYAGQVFRLGRHIERLRGSARELGWAVVPSEEELLDNLRQVLHATEAVDARLRLTVTSGSLRPVPGASALTIVASATERPDYPREYYQRGITVGVSPYTQGENDPTVGHKTTSYFARLAALRDAHARGWNEALWFTAGDRLAEGSISNVFVIFGATLATPPLDTPVLPGITRDVVLEIAAKSGLAVEERDISRDELKGADEIFLTSSLMEIMPVVRIEREPVGAEKPGDLTRKLGEAYQSLIEGESSDE